MQKIREVIVLTKEEAAYGRHSSYYTQAFDFKGVDDFTVTKIKPGAGFFGRSVGKLFSGMIKAPGRDQNGSFAECRYFLRQWRKGDTICHIAAVEDHLPLLHFVRTQRPRWIGTVHFPPSCWREEDLCALEKLGCIVTLCERDRQYFGMRLPGCRVVCIPHGVDTDFFHPSPDVQSSSPRLLFVGKWLRDFDMAGSVLGACLEKWPEIGVDIVVSRRWTKGTTLDGLHSSPRVRWHENVSDEELRILYQQAWLLVLPLKETSANNAIVEALASGLVPVVNDTGGIRDYGGGDIYAFPAANTPEAWLQLVGDYLASKTLRQSISQACRIFAVSKLDWRIIRELHLEVYRFCLPKS